MTIDISVEVLVGASLFMGGQLAILAQVVRSNRDQGRRIGALEGWRKKKIGVAVERRRRREAQLRRHFTNPSGVPVSREE